VTDEQTEVLQLIEDILTGVSEHPVYRHFRETVGGHEVFIEDMGTSLYFHTKTHGPIIDLERLRHRHVTGGDEVDIHTWNEVALVEMVPLLKNYYVLELLANL
jgi:hypothetical protein